MRAFRLRFVGAAVLTLLLPLSGCAGEKNDGDAGTQPTRQPQVPGSKAMSSGPADAGTTPAPRSSSGAGGNPLGIGEPRKPQPYTLEDRYLDAARRGDRRTIELALEHGVKVDSKDDLGRSALLLAARDAGSLELVRLLHEKGAPIDEPDAGGRAALSWAAGEGRLDIVRELVEKGAQVDRPDVQKRTPLAQAVLGNYKDVVAFLLDAGANVNRADQFGDTPLIMACAKGYGEMAALLLQRGADPALKDQEGRTARDRAAAGTRACLDPAPKIP